MNNYTAHKSGALKQDLTDYAKMAYNSQNVSKRACTNRTTRTFASNELSIDYQSVINYATLLIGHPLINRLSVRMQQRYSSLRLKIGGYYIPEVEIPINYKEIGETIEVDSTIILPVIDKLRLLSDAVYTEFVVKVCSDNTELALFRFPLIIQAWNHWTANNETIEEIACFVQPYHNFVAEIVESAASHLLRRSGYSGFCGYDCPDVGDVIEQMRAVWAAVSELNLKYLTINESFTDSGQRVMTLESIKHHHSGNCLDITLLLCSCFERIGLSPCMVFFPGHVVCGVWMYPDHHITNAVTTACQDIKDCATSDSPILMLLESTCVTNSMTFDEAVMNATSLVSNKPIEFLVDVINARRAGVRSIPFTAIDEIGETVEDNQIHGYEPHRSDNLRVNGWERKLLDMTLRNSMLNLKPCKTIVPIWEREVAKIVHALKSGTLSALVGPEGKDNVEQLKNLYRAARTAIEENGANSLFVSVGTLKWYDIDNKEPHLAPLLFIPVQIVRKKAMTYEVQQLDEEPLVNVTLVEMLRQMFGVTFPEFDDFPFDKDGFPDYRRIFSVFEEHICEVNKRQPHHARWELPMQSFIGIFSFTKFLMWHDIHTHTEIIEHHPLLSALIMGNYPIVQQEKPVSSRQIEAENPMNLMLPVDYDSSQLEAVAESHAGRSFVLHGPPGTGKSQTITNMIANAIYHGKRVLFVAEKKAALDVVRQRLNKIGLSRYCLELHSNKADKRSFFSQIKESNAEVLGQHEEIQNSEQYAVVSEILFNLTTRIAEITNALHNRGRDNLSLYDYICNYLKTGYTDLDLKYSEIAHLSPADIQRLAIELQSLDLVSQILGFHPSESELVGLYPIENTADNQKQLTDIIATMPDRIAKIRAKAKSWLNRWFIKKNEADLLAYDNIWLKLNSIANIDTNLSDNIDKLLEKLSEWNQAISQLRYWYHFSTKANAIIGMNAPFALRHYLNKHTGKDTSDAVVSAYFKTLTYYKIDNDSRLRGFNGLLHEQTVSQFSDATDEFQKLRQQVLLNTLENNHRSATLTVDEEKQLSLLMRRTLNNGRGVSLRKTISVSFAVLQKLFPCMLMSPISVAQYLEMKPDLFDLIIFDEASQMETPDAVGTIARGNSLIIVGDPKQLPPTRFFTTRTSAGEEVEESEDADSILEDYIALGMPARYLSRHYRSRHESLIAFSNANFYDNKLLTFPSYNDAEKKVSFINPSGIYDYGKTRTNKIEAEAVSKHVIDILSKSDSNPSIGIVAFSKNQSNLIEDILNSKIQRNKAIQKKLDEAKEPLFVKNLENVQGDERDIIIFSIGYGPDENGNVSLNFGPLNQSGGERRLNVAVSRAREEMFVFSSLLPNHIPAEGSYAKGVIALRNFLSYSIDNSTFFNSSEATDAPESLIADIARRLSESGFGVVTKVGRSSFKIDIAIIDPENPINYKCGIIIDGRDYNKLPTVRDREITVPSVLRTLGWRLYRIWAIDWIENPDKAFNDLIKTLKVNTSESQSKIDIV